MRFTELFAAFGSSWPSDDLGLSWPPSADDIAPLLLQIDDGVELHNVITDVDASGTITVDATLQSPSPPASTELVSRLFPSLRFEFAPPMDWSSGFRASVALDGTVSVQIDTLPLRVLVPSDMLKAHATKPAADTGITLSTTPAAPTVITRSFSFLLEASGDFRLDPHLPISIGPCTLFGLSMRAVHDLQLIASPRRAFNTLDWVVRPLDPENFSMNSGGLGFGGLEFDWSDPESSIAKILNRLRISDDEDTKPELVFEDLVLPAVFVPPIPQHGTVGFRKTLSPEESLLDHFTFRDAPIVLPIGDSVRFFLSQLYFQMPPDGEPLRTGLSIEGGFAFDTDSSTAEGSAEDEDWELEFGMIDGDLLRISVARTPPAASEEVALLRLDMFSHSITFFRARFGLSVSALQESGFDENAFQALTDILIEKKPDESASGGDSPDDSAVQVRGEDGRDFVAALTDLGWDRGKLSFEMTTPKGATLELGPFALVLHEVGLSAEHGATYISISGGIRAKIDPFTGKLWFTRLRGRLTGNPDAPAFKLGGLGVEIEIEDVVEVSVHGHFREELLPDGTQIKEQGLGGKIVIYAGSNKWGLSVDVYWGERIPPVDPRIDYLLFQVVLFGAIPMGPVELRQIEALYADSLLPKIEEGDREAGELKYYSWLKRARPTAVAEERGLSAWTPQNDAWAFGLGLGISFTGCGDVCLLTAFGLGFDSEDAAGLVIVLELKLFGGDKPLALGIFEYDFRTDAFVLQIQIDLTLDQLIDNFPEDLKVKLGGTFVFGNQPGLVAIGRLDHPDTWIGAKIEIKLSSIVDIKIHLALCFEWLEGSHVGGGFTFSLSARGDLGVIRLEGWGSLLIVVKFMISGTNDFVARVAFDAGFALVLFGFLRFGISISLLAEWLAHTPNFFVFRVTFRLETPWFLPDVSYTLECVSGELSPAARGMVTGPLLDASARGVTGSKVTEVRRIDGLAGGEQPRLFSVNELRVTSGAWQGESDLVPLDATIEIQFSPMLQDMLEISLVGINPAAGKQTTGDDGTELTAWYQLVGLRVRRRPVDTTDWTTIEDLTETNRAKKLRWKWDVDTRTGGETVAKKLLLNGNTPFSVGYENPAADDELLEEFSNFPCCDVRPPDVAVFDFQRESLGLLPSGFVRHFVSERYDTQAPIRITGAPCVVREPALPGADNDRVGGFNIFGRSFTIGSQEDLGRTLMNVAVVGARESNLVVVARDRLGTEVFRQQIGVGGNQAFMLVDIDPGVPYRNVDVRLVGFDFQVGEGEVKREGSVVLDFAECITAAELARWTAEQEECDRVETEGEPQVVNLLAQHEYEITIRTRVSVRHTTTEWEPVEIDESIRFVTAGPPGLNETPEPGLELEPHVESATAGGRGILYRDESVHLVLSDSMRVFGAGPGGDAEADFRLPVTLTVHPVFSGKPEDEPTSSSFTSDEWFLARRGLTIWFIAVVIWDFVAAATTDPLRLRLRDLWEQSTGTCEPDDVWLENRPRLGVDPFDPSGRTLWKPRTTYHAAMRPEGSPVVERKPFEPQDIAAFSSTSGTWVVQDERLVATSAASASFGDDDWDLLTLELTGEIELGGSLSAGVLIGGAGGGLLFEIERRADGSGRLTAHNEASGGQLGAEALDVVGAEVSLIVDVFIDSIRVQGGGASIVIEREGRGPGICTLAGEAVSIRSLSVRGLEMYGFDFATSRYESFQAHIGSAEGATAIAVDGAEPLSVLLPRTSGAVADTMAVEASNADRERVFADVASSLAMPLREDPERLHVEVGVRGGDRWLVLESPEPMDFVEEVSVRLQRKVPLPKVDERIVMRFLKVVRKELGDSGLFGSGIPRLRGLHRRLGLPGFRDERLLVRPRPGGDVLITIQLDRNDLVVTEVKSGRVRRVPLSMPLSAGARRRFQGLILEFDSDGALIGWSSPRGTDWVDVAVVPLQNADATKVFLLPGSAGALVDGCYRATFNIERAWFDTTAPTSSANTYLDSAEITFLIGSV